MAEIVQVKTSPLTSETGARDLTHGIMVAVNADDAGMTTAFVEELARTIALQRMCSPPDTSVLVVSVIGRFDGDDFLEAWRTALSKDAPEIKALQFFLSEMQTATVVHSKRDGTVLQTLQLKTE